MKFWIIEIAAAISQCSAPLLKKINNGVYILFYKPVMGQYLTLWFSVMYMLLSSTNVSNITDTADSKEKAALTDE